MMISALGSLVEETAIRFLGHDEHSHPEPHLIFVVSGTATLIVDGREYALGTHEAAWLQVDVPHALRVHDGGMVLGPLLEATAEPPARVVRLGVVPALVEAMMTTLVASPTTEEQIRPFRRALGRVLADVATPYFPVVLPAHPAARLLAREAMRSPRTLEDLAARHRMSVRQVQRIFAAETGCSFTRWRTRVRLNGAVAHVLGGGDLAAAARLAGYATRSGLLRALSRETGTSMAHLAEDPVSALAA
ncbi:helix-turn-helix domain-containing protein [Microbacterium sp. NPDC055903]